MSSATIGQIAASHGVPASLAAAIAWQESGFDNSMVSDANARGVMQILPGTWTWINGNLSSGPLNANSARTTSRPGSCTSDSSCGTRVGIAPAPWPRTTRDSDR